jgi:hypothetical protein
MNHKYHRDLRSPWQKRADSIRLRETHEIPVGDIAQVLSGNRGKIKYRLGDHPSGIRQKHIY